MNDMKRPAGRAGKNLIPGKKTKSEFGPGDLKKGPRQRSLDNK